LMAIPVGAPGARPLVSYQHGTALLKSGVPSTLSDNGETAYVALTFVTAGYVLVAPDYLGMGDAPGTHPYGHADSEASASLDMLRAARKEAAALQVALSPKLFLTGYSMGGHATLALHRALERDNAGEFAVTASAPGDGPYDLSGTMLPTMLNSPTPYVSSVFGAYLLTAYQSAYTLYATPQQVYIVPFDTNIPPLFDGTHTFNEAAGTLAATLTAMMQPAYVTDLKTNPKNAVVVALKANNVYDWKPTAPIRLLHAQSDPTVPYQNATVARDRMTQLGGNVAIIDLGTNLDHFNAFNFAIPTAKGWFDSLQ
jgi:pimeloyl-ACP methyl ester carboxylesterase